MTPDVWKSVDQYLADHLLPPDPALDAALSDSAAAGLPAIAVSPMQGRLLHLLALLQGARHILEIGTLGGYSTICLARALPPRGGRLVTLELNPDHAKVARANLARAGVADKVDLRLGRALDLLPQLAAENLPPFDLVFIDADKPGNPHYVQWALRLARPGALLIVDNVIRKGNILDPHNPDPAIQGTRALYDQLAKEPRLTATALQTVGAKGYDGLILARINTP
jgi:predicted O-methyltransferase YrrM